MYAWIVIGLGSKINLNDMVSEINFFSFFSGSVLNIENADKIGCPTSH